MKKLWKKIYFLTLLTFGTMMGYVSSVQAVDLNIYNGQDVPAGGSSGTCAEGHKYNHFCRYSKHPGTRVSVVYYDGTSYQTIGKSIDVYPSKNTFFSSSIRHNSQTANNKISFAANGITPAPNQTSSGTYPVNSSYFNLSYFQPASNGNYQYIVLTDMPTKGTGEKNYWSDLFLKSSVDANGKIIEDSTGNKIITLCTGHSLSDKTFWSKPTEAADPNGGGINKIGYRILIEPLYIYMGKDNIGYVMTPTEYASLVWNTGSYTTTSQVSYYLKNTERLLTEFDDIGIKTTTACSSAACTATDVQFTGKNGKGHAVNIIDFSTLIENVCDYETGAGFPVGKPANATLTEQEKACCDEKIEEIQKKYELTNVRQVVCMLTCTSVPEYIACMNSYFTNLKLEEIAIQQEQKALMELQNKYPACLNCDYDEMSKIEEDYRTCLNGISVSEWMARFLTGQDTSCEINRRSAIATYRKNYPLCPPWTEDDCPWEECPPPGPICDENNPNHFPKAGDTNPDKTCCIYFENQMKIQYQLEAEEQGLEGTAIQNYISNKIDEWFNEDGKEFRLNCLTSKACDINDETLTEECCEELMEKYPEKPDSFWIGKGCKPEKKDECTWVDYEVSGLDKMETGDCSVSTSLEAKDSENWECIFESDNIKDGTNVEVFKDYYLKYNNPYCSVYCREDVKYDFPSDSMTVKAGNHFTVGNTSYSPKWSPVQFTSTRECKTNGSTNNNNSDKINTEQFINDWKAANDKVISTWDSWKIAQQKDWSYANSKRSATKDCDKRCVRYGTCSSTSCSGSGTNRTCTTSSYTCCKEYKYFGYTMYPATVNYASFGQSSSNVTPGSWCSTKGHSDPGSAAKADAHAKAKQDMETIETDILACTSWDNFDDYRYATISSSNIKATRYAKYTTYQDLVDYEEFNPDLTIDYDEPKNDAYDYLDLLDKNISPTTVSSNFSTTGASFTIKYNCPPTSAPSHRTCTKSVTFRYSPQKEAHATYTKNINYELQEGVFNVVLKPQGTAVHGSEKGKDSEQIYIDLGYSALHVHFMTPSGKYDIGLSYPAFTPSNNTSDFEHNFDQFIEEEPEYECTYNVYNEIITCEGENCDPCEGDNCYPCEGENCEPTKLRGLNLIYRPISLNDPFPGVEGEGRTPGSNWADNTFVENYITNNRGVETNRIYYDKYPMYQITLTPALIQDIREYNETTNYNDFNMDCLDGNGRECKSDFIRGNLEGGYDFSNHFRSCQMSGVQGTANCCGIGNWEDCNNQDGIER